MCSSDHTVSLDVPMVDRIGGQFSDGTLSRMEAEWGNVRISGVGVEDLIFDSTFVPDISQTGNPCAAGTECVPPPLGADEDHIWDAVMVYFAEHSWVQRIKCTHIANSCVDMTTGAQFNTVRDCHAEDFVSQLKGMRRYSYNVDGSMILVQGCTAESGRHDLVSGSIVTGPNVFADCHVWDTHNDIGPHHRWSTGQLFDSIEGEEMATRDRGNSGSGHGWTGGQICYWNPVVNRSPNRDSSGQMVNMQAAGASNWIVGAQLFSLDRWYLYDTTGRTTSKPVPAEPPYPYDSEDYVKGDSGLWDSIGVPVFPQSLYQAQLAARLDQPFAECLDARRVPEMTKAAAQAAADTAASDTVTAGETVAASPSRSLSVAEAEAAAMRDFGEVTANTLEAEATMAKYGVRLAEAAPVAAPAAAVHTAAAETQLPHATGMMFLLVGLALAAVAVRNARRRVPENPATGSADYGTHDQE